MEAAEARMEQLTAVTRAVAESEAERAVTFFAKRVFRAWRAAARDASWLRQLVTTVVQIIPETVRGRCDAPALVSSLDRLGYIDAEMLAVALEVSETSLADRLRESAPPMFVSMLKKHMRTCNPVASEVLGRTEEELVDIHPRSLTCRPADLVDKPTRELLTRAHESQRRASERSKALGAEAQSLREALHAAQAELAEVRTELTATRLELDEARAARMSAEAECAQLRASGKQAAASRQGREAKLEAMMRMLDAEMREADSARSLMSEAGEHRDKAIRLLKERSEALRDTAGALAEAQERRDEALAGWQAAEALLAKERARRRELEQTVAAVRAAVSAGGGAPPLPQDVGTNGAGPSIPES